MKNLPLLLAILFILPLANAYQISFYHNDHLGSTSTITKQDGSLISHIKYDLFGEPLQDPTMPAYNQKEYDETKLSYFNARYQDPETGRFLTSDSVEKFPNSYVYTSNNPLKYTDPTGNKIQISKDITIDFSQPEGGRFSPYHIHVNYKGERTNLMYVINPKNWKITPASHGAGKEFLSRSDDILPKIMEKSPKLLDKLRKSSTDFLIQNNYVTKDLKWISRFGGTGSYEESVYYYERFLRRGQGAAPNGAAGAGILANPISMMIAAATPESFQENTETTIEQLPAFTAMGYSFMEMIPYLTAVYFEAKKQTQEKTDDKKENNFFIQIQTLKKGS